MSLSPRRVVFNPVLSIRRMSRPLVSLQPSGITPPTAPQDVENSGGTIPTKIPFWRTRHGSWITAMGIILFIAIIVLGSVFGTRPSWSSHSSHATHITTSTSSSHPQQPSVTQFLSTETIPLPPTDVPDVDASTDAAGQDIPPTPDVTTSDDSEPTPPPTPPLDPSPPIDDPPPPTSLPTSISSSTSVSDGSPTTQPIQDPQQPSLPPLTITAILTII